MDSDPPAYWSYMFEADKKPTKQLHMLLTAIAKYIIEHIGDDKDKKLSPTKLAAFYKAVGGNYDSLFVDFPHHSISYIYQSIGCQHTLQPTANDFEQPSVPALTSRGFIRWQSIETLLQPEEQVPYLQYAVSNFGLKDPETGLPYPTTLPRNVFPLRPDAELEAWHTACGKRMKQQATPDESPERDDHASRPHLPPRTSNIRGGYNHVRPQYPPSARGSGAKDYFNSRPVFHHVPPGASSGRPGLGRSSTQTRRTRLAPEDAEEDSARPSRTRRRSVPENYFPTSPTSHAEPPPPPPAQENLRPPEENHTRRHSHPRQHHQRQRSTSSSSSTDEGAATSRSTSPRASPSAARVRKGPLHPQAAASNARYRDSIPPGSRPMPPSPVPGRARAATGGAIPVPTVKIDPRLASYSLPVDSHGRQLHPEEVISRNNSRSGNGVRWSRRPSVENFRDSGGDERDRDKVRRDDRMLREERSPRLGEMRAQDRVRSGSHDGRYGPRERDRERMRDRERERDSYTDREDRGRERSPAEEKKKAKKRWYEFA